MEPIYLDSNATTLVAPEVRMAMEPYFSISYGNPSSPYSLGVRARDAIELSRERIAKCLGLNSARSIVFTSGGTESNNTAIKSALKASSNKRRLIISEVEHSSIKRYTDELVKEGYEIVSIGVDRSGGFDWNQFEAALTDAVVLVSVMWVNNETGVIFPVGKIAERVKKQNILFHVDAVQAIGKLPIDLSKIPADYLSIASHKFHGPKGIGALFIRESAPFQPLIFGGGQERNRRAGTENVPGITGMAYAMEMAVKLLDPVAKQVRYLRDLLESSLMKIFPDIVVNGNPAERVFNTSNVMIPGIHAETFLQRLSDEAICASAGSACMSGAMEPSHVLQAMGRSREESLSSIRFSLSRFNTEDEIKRVASVMERLVSETREINKSKVL